MQHWVSVKTVDVVENTKQPSPDHEPQDHLKSEHWPGLSKAFPVMWSSKALRVWFTQSSLNRAGCTLEMHLGTSESESKGLVEAASGSVLPVPVARLGSEGIKSES